MKKYIIAALILALAATAPVAAMAEEGSDSDDRSGKTQVRSQLREVKDAKERDLKALATSTRGIKDIPKDIKDSIKTVRTEAKDDLKNATSSAIKRAIKERVTKDVFVIQHTRLVKQLELALNNLKQIRDRLVSRIQKAEQSGRNMTEAKQLLTVADAKIAMARQQVSVLAGFTATSTATSTAIGTSTATTTVDLKKPRQLGETAIKAVKEAHKAMVDVIRSIAHNMGRGGTATSTPVTTSTSTATTTP